MQEKDEKLMEKIISLCKRRGFVYPGSEIYGGLAGTWDYGPLGVALKNNIKNLWWKKFVDGREDMYGVDAAILMNSAVWKASGHVDTFTDPLIECTKCKKRFREDTLKEKGTCDECGGKTGEARLFNMMFATQIGAVEDSSATVYLRPETAQGMFVNFKNVVDSFHPKLPFGLAQIGKAFRNEITPRDFIFRVREIEQMEIEYFVKEEDWQKYFEYWKEEMLAWMESMGIDMNKVHELEVKEEDLAHYSKRTIDFEFDFPFGLKELYGLAYRTDFDLKKHNLTYQDEETNSKFVPHVIEPTFGVERTFLALMLSCYKEDTKGEEPRPYLAFNPTVAPVVCAVSPLLKNKVELRDYAHIIYRTLKDEFGRVMWDDNGNIGKRYRRQDEIGTPWCIVIDFDTLSDDSVTIRDRDTGLQERIKKEDIVDYIKERMN
ncbi:TPA: glycine--tRNA ligase [Candidatus Nomurabacteria bacterium]|uniref:glycine--tRNA ligase n=1 Tax=Candidatus Nomurabacteria bacterium GW2011_GWE1_35_16 TaxID=1618761 RepID=A0A0G0BC12_9BACT|nr:MAG: Glycine-tRNA ligase [Candidatus Nomurabacteria bacterium GW2011_GWF1_34_20]KKP63692.1 MAG: Glycine-tRNA ligase [Candidatus Nomurabacteria bacterium GW2011_GWE2_34_25]KKP66894.1 MAG: Glycine-tRNA ligase [Candidatus Nomurabacteria bacterium GW2011_GWE1_35_16]KKP83520.1 MAG: Glycine-tRNA ligase [Candidatus Nomurabacteria bacterium GW2011_GWF2_35_66]HAE36548.1 glycine--tRNA ligase [Candidatus Nomurabacteria bacterium]